jgi:hypothetical protein
MNSTGSLSIHMAVKFRQFSIQSETLLEPIPWEPAWSAEPRDQVT